MTSDSCIVRINYSDSNNNNTLNSTDHKQPVLLYRVEWVRECKYYESGQEHIICTVNNLLASQVRELSLYVPGQVLLIADKTIDVSVRPCKIITKKK